MRDLGLITNAEPATRLFTQGMVIKDGAKMSKSKGNVVSPDKMIEQYGADATRLYALFAAPPDRDLDWQEDGVAGMSRFLGRVWRLVCDRPNDLLSKARHAASLGLSHAAGVTEAESKLLGSLHRTIAKVTDEMSGRWHFNTCIAAIMTFVNLLYFDLTHVDDGTISEEVIAEVLRSLVLLISPFAPYLAAELWEDLGEKGAILRAPWPVTNPDLAREDELEVPVQINGKLVSVVRVPAGSTPDVIQCAALADEKVKSRTAGKNVVKIIVIPGKTVNLVVK
jgi:leucyl-tRNA synthetase